MGVLQKGRTRGTLACSLLAVAGLSSAAWADPVYSFFRITDNADEDIASQLSVDVTAGAGGTVDFTFYNNVGIASSITEVYFDDGTLLEIAEITSSGGVDYVGGATPADLPGGNDIDPAFVATQAFSTQADGNTQDGVDAEDEWLKINFTLQGTQTYADTLAALADGSLRIGLHIRSIGDKEDSDGFVNSPLTVVPLPGTAALAACGLLGLAGARGVRRRRD